MNVNMITCAGQATTPIVAAVSSVVPVEYAEIVASIASKSAGPGTRANVDEFTETTAKALEVVGGAKRGKAIIIINPVEPPMIMRNTIYCMIPAEAAEPGATQDAIRAAIDAAAASIRDYVPGYALRLEPQFEAAREDWGGIRPRRDLDPGRAAPPTTCPNTPATWTSSPQPPPAPRTCSPTRSTPRAPPRRRTSKKGKHTMTAPMNTVFDIRLTDTTLRDGSHAMSHQFTEDHVRSVVRALDDARVEVIEVTHGDGLGGSSFNYGFSKTPELDLIKAAVDEAKAREDRRAHAPGPGHHPRFEPGPRRRRLRGPHRHPLHRGRRLHPALPARPQAGHGNRRLPDALPPHPPGGARRSRPASWPTPDASASTSLTPPAP